ncbi:EAL domain-containing protein [Citrobacter sp. Cu233]|uniref:EAL domain-containing protein n=1 Tax=unclassified Citrobacter TaxID=2644389 RepID=UPI0025749ED7|nr:EAL domain-containing protein [Citrobacter sp. Cu233]MDM2934138.1 EAL domain-containing protein [Citrobacter sp. Cu233]
MVCGTREHIITLAVEITEREQLALTPETEKRLAWLRRAGAAVALDDFGTGYSNLAWVSSLKPDYLKIDKLFVSHMQTGHTELLDCVTGLAAKLGINTIAEGVETPEQIAYHVP